MKDVFKAVRRVSGTSVTVLLNGETGVGKEIVAKAIHRASPRRSKPFVPLNCGAIPATLLEATLFGYVRGAFTGALQSMRGVFEEANGGTVLLDEIGELPHVAQATLLRVLEDHQVRRLGSTKDIHVDFRLIAATHRDLEAMVAKGTFREDLWFRLIVLPITIPPLRDRREDIEPLALRFLDRKSVV